jgi:crossover junction endodeoxyribonuclease RuvC
MTDHWPLISCVGLGGSARLSLYARAGGGVINGAMGAHPIRILGIDPGLRRTGWGLIEADGNRLIHVACGSLATSARAALGARLLAIHDGLIAVIERYRPHEAAVEATFVNANGAATLKLGQARGIAMLVPAKAGLIVAEYAPNLVKKSIVGAGHGEKAQVRMMIGVLLPKADPQSEDAADALAIAVCHAHHRTSMILKVAAS